MKTLILVIVGLLLYRTIVVAGIDTDIPKTNQVILAVGAWTPSAEETQKALTAIQSFLEGSGFTNALSKSQFRNIEEHDKGYFDWMKNRIKKIREHAKEYRVQFVGEVRNDKKVIWCNFIPSARTGENDEFQQWRQEVISVKDGGFSFWQIDYDPGNVECSKFWINAGA
jgi:hypothetical protein